MTQHHDTTMWPSKSLELWVNASGKSTKSFYSTSSTGKWCVFPTDAFEVDELWGKILDLAEQDVIVFAKSSTQIARRYHDSYVICVYTLDWEDKDDVMRVKNALRSAGIIQELKYKRDPDTFNGVYGSEEEFLYTDTV